ncbi:tetratricopeptide repeat protein [Roseateles sp.]|uniref:tetratricopeptide repeat protein n=1 Tax=Roseateles sp. TaxID=1971397 RepID=UPI00326611E4
MKFPLTFPRLLLLCLALLSTLWMGAAQALPTVDQVQAAAKSGDYARAEKMMREVVTAKPDSARAHYVLAELLAHQKQFDEAAEHTRRARALDPAIKFADAAKFSAFEQALQRQQAAAAKATVPAALEPVPPALRDAPVERVERAGSFGGVPIWLLVAGAIFFIGLAARFMRRRSAAQSQPAFAGGGYGGGPAGFGQGGYGMPQQPSSGGPGMLGVGLGVAGGLAAGMLAERLLHGGHDQGNLPNSADAGSHAGGLIPGSFDGGSGAADELTRRDIDFGSGDGWGGGDAGGGDFGSSSDGGGDW